MSDKQPTQSSDNSKGNELKTLEQALTESNPEIFKNIPEPKKKEILRTFSVTLTQKIHTGPVPSPETLGEYNEVLPGAADRILTMAEKQQDHRMKIEDKAIGSQLRQSQLGQIFGFLIAMSAMWGGYSAIMHGHEWQGAILGTAGLTGLVSLFVRGKSKQAKSLDEKNKK